MVLIVRRFVDESVDESFEKLVGDPESDGSAARISLTNQSTPEHIARLRASIEETQSSTAPAALYQTLMSRMAGVEHESGLGLARIRVEGELDLSLEIDSLMVTITASCAPVRMHAHGQLG
jgi:hypothetical protein